MTQDEINFACESITELLEFAQKGLTMGEKPAANANGNKEQEKGIYGLSITMLIACAFDAMGKIGLSLNNKKGGNNRDRFEHIQNEYINNSGYGFEKTQFVDYFYEKYRNGLVHSGTLERNYLLVNNEKEKAVFDANKKTIYVQALVRMAKEVFDKLKIQCNLQSTSCQYMNNTTTGSNPTIIQISKS